MTVYKPQVELVNVAGITASTNHGAENPPPLLEEVLELDADETVAGTSLDVKVQDSFDDGAVWNDWVTFTQLTTDGREVKKPARAHGGSLRVVSTIVGGTWAYRVRMAGVPPR